MGEGGGVGVKEEERGEGGRGVVVIRRQALGALGQVGDG